jgi:hypothetical protein
VWARFKTPLALQVVRGGTLDTILLERDLVEEAKLIQMLSEISGYPPLDATMLDKATSSVAHEIPEKTAKKLGICPVVREGDRLLVVSSAATDKIALPELAYELNCVVVPSAATEIRVEQARSLVYGSELSSRYAKLLAKCGEHAPAITWSKQLATDAEMATVAPISAVETAPGDASEGGLEEQPRAATTDPPADATGSEESTAGVYHGDTSAATAGQAGAPVATEQAAAPQATATAFDASVVERQARRTAPTDRLPIVVSSLPLAPGEQPGQNTGADTSDPAATGAEHQGIVAEANTTALAAEAAAFDLERANDREELLITLLRAFHYYLPVVHLYAVEKKGRILSGRYALVDQHLDVAKVRKRRLGLDPDTQLARCARDGSLHVGPTPYADATGQLLKRLDLDAPQVAIIPICLRGRTVCLFVGHQRDNVIPHHILTPLSRLAGAGAQGLARLILRRKRKTEETEQQIEPQHETVFPRLPEQPPSQVSGEIADINAEPANSAYSYGPTNPPPSPNEKVIIDFDVSITTRTIEELVESLDQQPEGAQDTLAELRRRARRSIPWLLEHFPGKLRFKRTDVAELPDVADCSGVLQALVFIGRSVIPRLAPILVGGDEQTRFFATYLLSELTYPETVSLLAKRLRDASPSVRQAAIYGLRRSRELEQFPLIVEELRADLSHPDTRPQLAAMEALAALGDVVATPSLIALLNDDRPDLADTAHRSLIQLTKQDFGQRPQPWMTWWNRNRHRHRVEWMIDGLTHEVSEIREQAFVELRDLTGLEFGYAPDLPHERRQQIRHRFLQWWTDTGLYDFGRFA